MSKLFPVLSEISKRFFVSADIVKPEEVEVAGVKYLTAPLLFGKQLSLFGISQNDELLKTGTIDVTDDLDPAIFLAKVYFSDGSVVDTIDSPKAAFTFASARSFREASIDFTGKHANGNTFRVFGTVNLQTTNIELGATAGDSGPNPVGYTLSATRANNNTRPAAAA